MESITGSILAVTLTSITTCAWGQPGVDISACPSEPTLRIHEAGFNAEMKAKIGSLGANGKWGQATVGSARIMYMSALQAELCRFEAVHNNSDEANTIGENILSEVDAWFDDIAAAMDETASKMTAIKNSNNTRRAELANEMFKSPKLAKIDAKAINNTWTAPDYVTTIGFSADVNTSLNVAGLDARYSSKLASNNGTLLWAMQNINPKLRNAFQSGRTARDALLQLFVDVNALGQDILNTVPATNK